MSRRTVQHIYVNASDTPVERLGEIVAPGQEIYATRLEHDRWQARPHGHKKFKHVRSMWSDGTPYPGAVASNGNNNTEDTNNEMANA